MPRQIGGGFVAFGVVVRRSGGVITGAMSGSLTLHILRFLPKNLISRWFGRLAAARRPRWFAVALRDWFAGRFGLRLTEAEHPIEHYDCLTALFTRRLKAGLRPVDQGADALVSPVDGTIGVFGTVRDGTLIQAKGLDYTVAALVGDPAAAERFADGWFATLYLSPRDYHRIHSPVDGHIRRSVYEPGTLWPVNPAAVRTIPRLFAVNERVTTCIDSPLGAVAVCMVGATNVGSIDLAYAEFTTNEGAARRILDHGGIPIARGGHLGTFRLGSTVVLLFEGTCQPEPSFAEGAWLAMGSRIGTVARR